MFKSLIQIQAEQRAAGLIAKRDDDETQELVPTQEVLRARPANLPAVAGAGFTRLLPPTTLCISALSPDWTAANWDAPSPWCRIEGLPDHPDFAGNLKAFQEAQ